MARAHSPRGNSAVASGIDFSNKKRIARWSRIRIANADNPGRMPSMKASWARLLPCALSVLTAPTELRGGTEPVGPQPPVAGTRAVDPGPRVHFSRELKHPVDVLDYFPLQVGSRWTYRHTSKDLMGPDRVMITVQWVEDIQIVAHKELPEGKLVLRKTTVRDVTCEPPDTARKEDVEWCRQRPSRLTRTHYLIQGNYLFEVSEEDLELERLERFHDGFRGARGLHEPLPCFFFPMDQVSAWAERSRELEAMEQARLFQAGLGPAPNPGNYFWHVMDREEVAVPYGRVADAVHLHYGTLGGPCQVWFKRGIGVVRETVQRNLDFLSLEAVLLDFAQPAAKDARSQPK